MPTQGVQQVKLLLLYKTRDDPGALGQIAADLGPQKAGTAVELEHSPSRDHFKL